MKVDSPNAYLGHPERDGAGLLPDWELRFFTKEGLRPHKRVHKNDRQKIRPGSGFHRFTANAQRADFLFLSPDVEGVTRNKVNQVEISYKPNDPPNP